MLGWILLTIILTIIIWEVIKDLLNIRNIFSKYDGLSTEEMLAVKKTELKNSEKRRETKEEVEDFVDD